MLAARLTEPIDAKALGFFRRLYCIALALVTLSELWRMGDRYSKFVQFYGPIPPFEKLGLGLPPSGVVDAAGVLLIGALLVAASGVRRLERWALIAATVLFLVFFGTVLGWAKVYVGADKPSDHHTLHFYVLLLLVLAPRDKPAAWPLLAVRAALSVSYIGAAYSKLDSAGFRWLDGYNLQTIFLEKFSVFPQLTLGAALAQSHTLCLALSWATIAFELSFWTVLLWPRRSPARWVYVAAGVGFHASTWLLMGIWQFVASFCAVYLVFFEWPLRGPEPAEPSARPARSAYAAAGVLVVLLVGAFGRLHFWPLADFDTYSAYQDYRDQVDVIGCEQVLPDGTGKPCFGGTSAAIGAQIIVRLKPGENPSAAARRWSDDQLAQIPMAQRRLFIGRTLRLTLRWFPVVDGVITVKKEVVTVAQ